MAPSAVSVTSARNAVSPQPCRSPSACSRRTARSGACRSTAGWTSSATATSGGPRAQHRPMWTPSWRESTSPGPRRRRSSTSGGSPAAPRRRRRRPSNHWTSCPSTARIFCCHSTSPRNSRRSPCRTSRPTRSSPGSTASTCCTANSRVCSTRPTHNGPRPAEKRTLGAEADPPCHLIVDRGRIAGLWEFDPDTRKIVHRFFGEEDDALREAIAVTEEFVRDDLGDTRGFSLDSPKSRAPRLAALRA